MADVKQRPNELLVSRFPLLFQLVLVLAVDLAEDGLSLGGLTSTIGRPGA